MDLGAVLVQHGWTSRYLVADTNPQTIENKSYPRHLKDLKKVEKGKALWAGGDSPGLRPTETWANYAPETGAVDQRVLDQLNQVSFGLLIMKWGRHLAMISKGMVFEVHTESADWSRTAFDARAIEKWNWKSAVLVSPPGAEQGNPAPNKEGMWGHADLLQWNTVGWLPSLPQSPIVDPTSTPDELVDHVMRSHLKEGRVSLLSPDDLEQWLTTRQHPEDIALAQRALKQIEIAGVLEKRAGRPLELGDLSVLDPYLDTGVDWAKGPLPEEVNLALIDWLRDAPSLVLIMEAFDNLLVGNPSPALKQSLTDAEGLMASLD